MRDTNSCYSVGTDCSLLQTTLTHERGKEAILGNNLQLPFRSDLFDGVLSVGVVHHLASKERRIQALRELARILRVGGRVLIAVRSQDPQVIISRYIGGLSTYIVCPHLGKIEFYNILL